MDPLPLQYQYTVPSRGTGLPSGEPESDYGLGNRRTTSSSSLHDATASLPQMTDPSTMFELLNPLGRGSYGSVYQARLIDTGDIVAVKIIPMTEVDEMESVQKEIAMLRDCDHPNIVRYYGSWRTSEALWIAMEYCAGGSVSDIMAATAAPLPEPLIGHVCAETLAGLVYLHALGRVHRDIKCGNILLTESGQVKLADFGVAAQLTSTLTKRNTFIGTPHWMAPEVIQASQYDGKVDVWALGISAIEMAERYPPRWRVNPNRVIFMVVRDPPPQLAVRERWTLAFQDFIAQCLIKDPRARPTARYLQQHRFVGRDDGTAMRMLVPLVHRAKTAYAAAAGGEGGGGGKASGGGGGGDGGAASSSSLGGGKGGTFDDGKYSWRGVDGGGSASGTVMMGGGAVGGTVLSRPAARGEGEGGMGMGMGVGAGGTVVVSSASPVVGDGMHYSDGIASRRIIQQQQQQHQSPLLGVGHGGSIRVASPLPEASTDYLAAVQSAAGGLFSEQSSDMMVGIGGEGQQEQRQEQQQQRQGRWTPELLGGGGGGLGGALPSPSLPPSTHIGAADRAAADVARSRLNRMAERLYTLHSSGEVVPLPFLRATDLAPMALLGLLRAPEGGEGGGGLEWEAALEGLLAEDDAGDGGGGARARRHHNLNDSGGNNNNKDNNNNANATGELPPGVAGRVYSSPVLRNLASALAAHRSTLHEQRELGAPPAVTAATHDKAEALGDTLRAILC